MVEFIPSNKSNITNVLFFSLENQLSKTIKNFFGNDFNEICLWFIHSLI